MKKDEAKMTPKFCMTRRMGVSMINIGRLRYRDNLAKKNDSHGTMLRMNCVRG